MLLSSALEPAIQIPHAIMLSFRASAIPAMADDKEYIEEEYEEESEDAEEREPHLPQELHPPKILNYPFQLLRRMVIDWNAQPTSLIALMTSCTIEYFEKEIIDLSPTYQRDVVWNGRDNALVICAFPGLTQFSG